MIRRACMLATWLMLAITGAPLSAANLSFDADFEVFFDPPAGLAHASIKLTPDSGRVIQLDLRMPADHYSKVKGDGQTKREGDRLIWSVPETGGTLRYDVKIDHKRENGAFDARMTADWVIVRGDDLFPPAVMRSVKGSEARSRLRILLPQGWTDRETGYKLASDGRFIVVSPKQRFDRPVGWIVAGKLVTRSEKIDQIDFRVTGPTHEGFDRIAILSMLRIATPEAIEAFGRVPDKVLIVGAGDPMWRGGLAGPRSFWLHADRRLQSENGTSPLLHELTHTLTGIHGARREDWIAEGMAEYYSIELSRRSGLLSEKLADRALRSLRKRGAGVKTLEATHSSGERTARAVAVFADLDAEIRAKSDGKHSLDTLTRALMRLDEVSIGDLERETEKLIGSSDSLRGL